MNFKNRILEEAIHGNNFFLDKRSAQKTRDKRINVDFGEQAHSYLTRMGRNLAASYAKNRRADATKEYLKPLAGLNLGPQIKIKGKKINRVRPKLPAEQTFKDEMKKTQASLNMSNGDLFKTAVSAPLKSKTPLWTLPAVAGITSLFVGDGDDDEVKNDNHLDANTNKNLLASLGGAAALGAAGTYFYDRYKNNKKEI
jgi:hypothetical protein